MKKDMVSVVIVNYNRKEYLKRCLDSLKEQDYSNKEIIIVDNNSNDGSIEMVGKLYPDVKVIRNRKNEFYCKPQNKGIKICQGEYILPLNNDVCLDKAFIREMVLAIKRDEKIGMVSGKVFLMDGKTLDSTGQFLGKSRKPIDRGFREQDRGQYDRDGYIFGPGGIAPLFRKKAMDMTSPRGEYFDESFEIFYEDLDFAWRLNRFGWKAFYTHKAIAYHVRGGTARRRLPNLHFLEKYNLTYLSSSMTVFLIRNRYLTMLKNDSLLPFLLNLPYILYYELRLWTYILCFKADIIIPLFSAPKYFRRAIRQRCALKKRMDHAI